MHNEDELEFLKEDVDWLSNIPESIIYEVEKGNFEKLNWLFKNGKIPEIVFLRAQQTLKISNVTISLGGRVSKCPQLDDIK